MMRLMNNKKNVKIISFAIAAIFILGIAGLAYTQMATPAMASPSSNIGVIDTSKVITQDDLKKANEELMAYQQQLKKEFDEKSANMDDKQKKQYYDTLDKQMTAKQSEIENNMKSKVTDAAKAIGDAKGLTVILDKNAVLYGGVDVTDQVSKKLSDSSSSNSSSSSDSSK